MVKRRYLVGWVLAALLVALNISAVGAAVPQAANPNYPVAVGAGAGITPDGRIPNGGTAGLTRSTIQNPQFVGTQTNVSAIPSSNPNETAALYRPGGTYAIFWEETQAQTVSTSRYSLQNGASSSQDGQAFTFVGNAVTATVGGSTVTFLLPVELNAGWDATPVGGTFIPGGTIVVPGGQTLTGANAIVVSRRSINGVLPQGYYIVRDAQNLIAGNGSSVGSLPANSVIVVSNDGQVQTRDSSGAPIYNTVLVRPITFNPPNGTTTGEPTGADIVSPFTTSGKVSVFFPYTNNNVLGNFSPITGGFGSFGNNIGQTRP